MIDHSGHPHPATPKARALCRANGGTGVTVKPGTSAPKTQASAPALTSAKIPTAPKARAPETSKTTAATVKAAQRSGVGRRLDSTEADRQAAQKRKDEQAARLKRIADRQKSGVPSTEGIEKSFKSGVVSSQTLSGGAISETSKVKFKDGTYGVVKKGGGLGPADLANVPASQRKYMSSTKDVHDSEELGSLLSRALGTKAPEVIRIDEVTTVQRFSSDKPAAGQRLKIQDTERLARTDDGMLIGLTDQLVGNPDRNLGNWLREGDSLTPIDFGNSWGKYVREKSESTPTLHGDDEFAYMFNGGTPSTPKWKEFDFHPEDMVRVKEIMTSLKGEFAKRGRSEWWSWSMGKLEAMTPYATGTKRRIK